MSIDESAAKPPRGYVEEDVPTEQIAQQAVVARALAGDVRALVSATVLTDVDDERVEAARALIRQATGILEEQSLDGSFGTRVNSDGTRRSWGNAMTGIRIGYLITPPGMVDTMRAVQEATISCANAPGQHAAIAADDQGDVVGSAHEEHDGHAQPVARFLPAHVVDPIGHLSDPVDASHGGKSSKEQPQ